MTKLIVHIGTGTIIDADDKIYVLDLEHLNDSERLLVEDEDSIIELCHDKGRLLRSEELELHRHNSISYSESSIKEEMEAPSFETLEDDIKDWILNFATHEDFELIAKGVLFDERTWEMYPTTLCDSIREVYGARKKERVI